MINGLRLRIIVHYYTNYGRDPNLITVGDVVLHVAIWIRCYTGSDGQTIMFFAHVKSLAKVATLVAAAVVEEELAEW